MKYVIKFLYVIFVLLFVIKSIIYSYTLLPLQLNKGETLIYDITVFNIKVAEQKTIIKDIVSLSNRQVYYIHTTIKTVPSINKLYKLNDTIELYLDVETLLPVLIKTKISEGKHKNNITITIDNKNKSAVYIDKYGKKIFKFKSHFLGLTSLLYYVRAIRASPNENIGFTIHNKRTKQIVRTQVKYIRTSKYIPALKRKVKSIKFEGKDNKQSNLWITHDKYRIHYEFTSIKIPVASYGYITFINKLKKYKKGKKN